MLLRMLDFLEFQDVYSVCCFDSFLLVASVVYLIDMLLACVVDKILKGKNKITKSFDS